MINISLNAQIEEVEYELKMRRRVYPHLARSGKERQSVLDLHMQRMQAVVDTLYQLQSYQQQQLAKAQQELLDEKLKHEAMGRDRTATQR